MIQSQTAKYGMPPFTLPPRKFRLPPQLARSWQQPTSILLVDYLPRGHTITGEY
jgi:hypothetical protein